VRKSDDIVLWPVYFDSNRTRTEGRRVPKTLGKPSPTIDVIAKAVESLGFSYRLVSGPAHPRHPWRETGLVLIRKEKPKSQILKEIANALQRLTV